MNEISNSLNLYSTAAQPPPMKGVESLSGINLDAHSTDKMKLERPKPNVIAAPALIQPKHLFVPEEADNYIKHINTDIYDNTQKEKSHHEFNFKRYFTIFGILALITAAIAYFRRA